MNNLDAVLGNDVSVQFKDKLSYVYVICKRDWDYFKNSSGELTPELRWLPHELAAALRSERALLSEQSMKSLVSDQSQAITLADMDPDHSPPALRQQPHVSTNMFGFMPGDRVIVPNTPVQRIVPGSNAITNAEPNIPCTRLCTELQGVDFWVW